VDGFEKHLEGREVVFESFLFETEGDFKSSFDKKDSDSTNASKESTQPLEVDQGRTYPTRI
jgi:hypothetical protein